VDWDNARIFLGVARAGQFLAASRRLNLDHATVSRRIGALETSLGARLFDRRTSGCFLTPAGERFLAAAERMEADMLRTQAEIGAADVDVAGAVRVGAPDGFGTLFLAGRIGPLVEKHPGLVVQLAPLPRTFSLSKREADIAIVVEPPEAGRLRVRKLTDYTLRLYAAKSYLARHGAPRDLEDLLGRQLVTYVQDLIFTSALNFLPEVYEAGRRRFECASVLGQFEAVRAGVGIGALHHYSALNEAELTPVLPEISFRRSYYLITHADTHDLMRVRTVSDYLVSLVERNRALFN
jgi:DNA-binding transcriptional LysR family regulator